MTQPLDLGNVKTYPLSQRKNLVRTSDFGKPFAPDGEYCAFLDSLPNMLRARDFKELCLRTVNASRKGGEIILAIGAHQIKLGLAPFIMRLMGEGLCTAVAMNGAGIIHDAEIALIGETSEDVAQSIQDGSFGMARETGELVNAAAVEGASTGEGFARALGRLIAERKLPHREYSLLNYCHEHRICSTAHVAYGTDIVHMHPSADGAAIGKATEIDFRKLAAKVCNLKGGVYMNVGSAVILPEVFLKCLSIARNLGHDVSDFTSANLDMVQHYRPQENVVRRPMLPEGKGFALTGNLEILFPLLTYCLLDLKAKGG